MARKIDNRNYPIRVNFNLRATTPENIETPVNAVVRFNNKRIVISGITKVQPRHWKKGEISQSVNNPHARDIRIALADAESKIVDCFNDYVKEHNAFPIDLTAFRDVMRKRVFNIKDTVKIDHTSDKSVCNYISRFIDDVKAGKRTKKKDVPFAKDSYKSYGNLLKHLNTFNDSLNFDGITLGFYYDFKEYIYASDLAPSYFGVLIKCLKTIMSTAQDEGYHNNEAYKHRKFEKIASDNEDAVYLDGNKLDILYNLDIKEGYLNHARDLFLIGCYTGLRFSDFTQIEPSMFCDGYLRIRTQKTGERIVIPITDNLQSILEKHHYKPLPISNQKLNEYIKEVGELAGFNEPCDRVEYKQGRKVIKKVPFHSLMTTHTARRSFASNAFSAGIPSFLIMAITGHRTERAFLTYIRQTNEDKAKMYKEFLQDIGRKNMKAV